MTMTQQTKGTPLHLQEGQTGAAGLRDRLLRQLAAEGHSLTLIDQNHETLSMAVERYGGTLLFTWLDRPLSIAGRVTVETGEGIENKLIDIDKDLLLIPNVAIHMNRQVNDGYKWNSAVDTLPLVGSKEAAGKLQELLEKEAVKSWAMTCSSIPARRAASGVWRRNSFPPRCWTTWSAPGAVPRAS